MIVLNVALGQPFVGLIPALALQQVPNDVINHLLVFVQLCVMVLEKSLNIGSGYYWVLSRSNRSCKANSSGDKKGTAIFLILHCLKQILASQGPMRIGRLPAFPSDGSNMGRCGRDRWPTASAIAAIAAVSTNQSELRLIHLLLLRHIKIDGQLNLVAHNCGGKLRRDSERCTANCRVAENPE